MAIKRILTTEEFSGIPEHFKSEYKANEAGDGYILDLSDYEDPGAAVRAKNHEKTAHAETKKKLTEYEAQLTQLNEEREAMLKGSVPKSDVEKLETTYKTKLSKRESELTGEIAGLRSNLDSLLVDSVATSLASEISTAPKLILPHIRARLKAEYVDGKGRTVVLDGEGNTLESGLDGLRKEFLANNEFSAILIGSKASGGGAAGAGKGGALAKDIRKMTATEEARFANENPEEYQRQIAALSKG